MHRPLSPPPRSVPLTLRIANQFNIVGLIGWAVLGFTSIFVWVFVANADLSFITFRGEVTRAPGRITHVEQTSASENETPVIASHYEYSVAGRPFRGIAYATGGSLPVGQAIHVEYATDDPAKSRIPGMRRAMFGPFVLFVVIFPVIALAIALGAFLHGRRRNHLLENGILAFGTFKEKLPTNMHVNRRPVWELVFEFTARDGRRYEATARTTDPSRLEDERQEALLYDPDDPSRAFMLDDAPARPQLDEDPPSPHPHPAGDPGLQINLVDPPRQGRRVLYVRAWDAVAIGRLFLAGDAAHTHSPAAAALGAHHVRSALLPFSPWPRSPRRSCPVSA